jgi:hypothetical protein
MEEHGDTMSIDVEEEARDERIEAQRRYEGEQISMAYDRYVEEEYDRWCEAGLREFEECLDYESYEASD